MTRDPTRKCMAFFSRNSAFCYVGDRMTPAISQFVQPICVKSSSVSCFSRSVQIKELPTGCDHSEMRLARNFQCFFFISQCIFQLPDSSPISPEFLFTAGYGNLCDSGKPCDFHQDGSEGWRGWNTAGLIETESFLSLF